MGRRFGIPLLTIVIAAGAAVAAQEPQPPRAGAAAKATEAVVTYVGCVRPGADSTAATTTPPAGSPATTAAAGQFILTNVAVPTATESATASRTPAAEAPASEAPAAVGTSGSARAVPQSIILEGAAVAPHLNQRVEVTGTFVPAGSPGGTGSTTSPPASSSASSSSASSPAPGRGSAATVDATMTTPQRLQVSAVRRVVGACGPQ